jgi:hypothetical protein
MTTVTAHPNSTTSFSRRLRPAAAVAFALAVLFATVPGSAPLGIDPELLEGRAPTAEELRPSVEAAFQAESYKPGTVGTLEFFNAARGVTLQLFHTGPETTTTVGNSEMQGLPVTGIRPVGRTWAGRVVHVEIGSWASGVYFARLAAADGRVGFAPFIVAPDRLGTFRVAVVLPTLTWQAYNIRDDNGDGKGDSWYASWKVKTAHLYRPYLDRGVPYHFRNYDLPFLHWLDWTGHQADFLSDGDLAAVRSPRALARAYDLIVFPGHHEYVTTHEYALVRGYRDLGGNLAFLSANNFFWQTLRSGNTIERTEQWRDLDLPEASLIGTSYRANDDGQHRGPWIVRDAEATPWLFAGAGLVDGSTFGSGGIEIDKTSAASPANVQVLAEIPDVLGPGLTAQMTYYETPSGAKVFAAGAFTLAGEVLSQPVVGQMIGNLWAHLSQP